MSLPYDESSLACVADDALNLLYRASANLCTILFSNLTQSQGHVSALLIG